MFVLLWGERMDVVKHHCRGFRAEAGGSEMVAWRWRKSVDSGSVLKAGPAGLAGRSPTSFMCSLSLKTHTPRHEQEEGAKRAGAPILRLRSWGWAETQRQAGDSVGHFLWPLLRGEGAKAEARTGRAEPTWSLERSGQLGGHPERCVGRSGRDRSQKPLVAAVRS